MLKSKRGDKKEELRVLEQEEKNYKAVLDTVGASLKKNATDLQHSKDRIRDYTSIVGAAKTAVDSLNESFKTSSVTDSKRAFEDLCKAA